MRIFVLCTGRCGSVTLAKACAHITNYTVGHESRIGLLGTARLDYPDNHIEIDNRLAWMLGRLDTAFPTAVYAHLCRDRLEVARSHALRLSHQHALIRAYRDGVLQGAATADPIALAMDMVDTVEQNIELFLRGRNASRISMTTAKRDFHLFWDAIGAVGDLRAALAEWEHKYNAS